MKKLIPFICILAFAGSVAAQETTPPAADSSVPAAPAAPAEKQAPVSETLAPITVDSEEASYIRRMRKLRRELETTRMEAAIMDERLKINEAFKRIKQQGVAEDGAGGTSSNTIVPRTSYPSGATPPGGAPMAVAGAPGQAGAVPAGHATDGVPAAAGGQSERPPVAVLPPRVVGIVNGAADIEYHGAKQRYRPGDVFEEHRVIKVGFDGVLLQLPDGARRTFTIEWP